MDNSINTSVVRSATGATVLVAVAMGVSFFAIPGTNVVRETEDAVVNGVHLDYIDVHNTLDEYYPVNSIMDLIASVNREIAAAG